MRGTAMSQASFCRSRPHATSAMTWLIKVRFCSRASTTSLIARSRSTCGYFLGAGTVIILRGIRPSINPGAVQMALAPSLTSANTRRIDDQPSGGTSQAIRGC